MTAALCQRAGIGRYTRELARALVARRAHRYVLFAAHRATLRQALSALDLPPDTAIAVRTSCLSQWAHAILWHRLRLPVPGELWFGRASLFHATDFLAPPLLATRRLVTIHDLSFLRLPERTVPALVQYLRRTVPTMARRADHLVADSVFTRREMVDLLGIDENRISVAYPGVGASFRPIRDPLALRSVADRWALPPRFVLGVGTLEPRKDWPTLIQAFGRLGPLAADCELVIAGAPGWLMDDIQAAVRQHPRVRLLGFVPDEDLPALYSCALAFAYPSVYEGFGLPALEALACGVPVLVANASSLPEVVGDAALRVPPGDIDAWAQALARLLTDDELRVTLARRGPLQASRFRWDGCAAAVEAAYERVLGSASGGHAKRPAG